MSMRAEVRKGVAEALRWVRDQLTEEAPAASPPDEPSPSTVRAAASGGAEAAASEAAASGAPVEVASEAPAASAAVTDDPRTYDAIIEAFQTIFDPEIPVDIYNLGLIYGVEVKPDRTVHVRMTLTSPNCPSAQALPEEVQQKAESVEGVVSAEVEIVWEPAWTPDMMSEEARLELNV
jgi:FeS assembly SUF system protein